MQIYRVEYSRKTHQNDRRVLVRYRRDIVVALVQTPSYNFKSFIDKNYKTFH